MKPKRRFIPNYDYANIKKGLVQTDYIIDRGRKGISLDRYENPYPPSESALRAVDHCLDKISLISNYTLDSCDTLREAIVSRLPQEYDIRKDNVFIGHGANEVLALAFRSFFNLGAPVVFSSLTYPMYKSWCDAFKIPFYESQPTDDLRLRFDDYVFNTGGAVIANPDVPTASEVDEEFIRGVLEANRRAVLILDEAYAGLGAYSALKLVQEYNNLLVVRSLSKSHSLANFKVGIAFGNIRLIDTLERAKASLCPHTVGFVTQTAATAAVNDVKYYKSVRDNLITSREHTSSVLRSKYFTVLNSNAGFFLAKHRTASTEDVYKYLLDNYIYVRYQKRPYIKDWLGINVGRPRSMRRLIDCVAYIDKQGNFPKEKPILD